MLCTASLVSAADQWQESAGVWLRIVHSATQFPKSPRGRDAAGTSQSLSSTPAMPGRRPGHGNDLPQLIRKLNVFSPIYMGAALVLPAGMFHNGRVICDDVSSFVFGTFADLGICIVTSV